MKKLTLNLIFIIPIIGLISGLSLGVIIPLFMMSGLYLIKNNMRVEFSNFKLELTFFSLLFMSCFWAPNPLVSVISLFRVFSIVIVAYLLITNAKELSNKIPVHQQRLTTSIICALILFYIEFFSKGVVTSWFRGAFQYAVNNEFYLHYLDRGCSVLALVAWVAIARLQDSGKAIYAFVLYVLMTITFALSDSLAAFVGFIVAGLVFIFTKYSFFRSPIILSIILSICSILFIVMAIALNPHQISEGAKDLPISAKHRLFIWDFVSEKAMQRPVLGWGHGASRQIEVANTEMIELEGYELHPLPTHPHNNLIQIFLENGIIGLALYIALMCKYLFKWYNSFKNNKNSAGIIAAGYACFATFFIISMISFNMWQSWWLCSFLWVATLFAIKK